MAAEEQEGEGRLSFRKKFNDPEYRRKFLHTLVLFAAFLVLGIADTIHFPAFLDLALITDSNVEQASVFYTSMAVGGLVGTVGMGFLFDKFPTYRSLLLAGANLGSAFTLTSIPWSTDYYLTILIFFLAYIFNLAFDTGTHADLLSMWGADGKMFLQFLHFSYSLGSILSPIIVEPFLAPDDAGNSTCYNRVSNNDSLSIIPTNPPNATFTALSPNKSFTSATSNTVNFEEPVYTSHHHSNESSFINNDCDSFESRIHYAYLIVGILCFLTAVFLVAEAYMKCIDTRQIKKEDDPRLDQNQLPKYLHVVLLSLVVVLYVAMCAPGNTIPSYIMPFGVEDRQWRKDHIAYLTAVYWAVFAAARLAAVIVIKFISPAKLLSICFVVLAASMGGLWFAVAYENDTFVKICIILSSGGFSVSFPTGFIYVEKDIMKVSGKIASLIMVATNGAGIVNPLLLGYLLQEVSVRWYIYLSLAQVLIAIAAFVILQVILKTHVKARRTVTIEIDINSSEQENFLQHNQDHALQHNQDHILQQNQDHAI